MRVKLKNAPCNGKGQYRVNYFNVRGRIFIARRSDRADLPLEEDTPLDLFDGWGERIYRKILAMDLSFFTIK